MTTTPKHPATLVTGRADAQAPGGVGVSPAAMTLVAVVAVLALALFISRRRRLDPKDRAFLALTRKLGLDRRDRARLRAMCRTSHDPHPVALVLSRSAFQRVAKNTGPRLARALPALEARLFGARADATPRAEMRGHRLSATA